MVWNKILITLEANPVGLGFNGKSGANDGFVLVVTRENKTLLDYLGIKMSKRRFSFLDQWRALDSSASLT